MFLVGRALGCWMALALAWASVLSDTAVAADPIRVATFQADVTPPLGAPLCDALVPPAAKIVDKLWARGVVILGGEKPIVLCALDFVGVGNGGHKAWRTGLAQAAGTTVDRVAIHCLHQHDAPGCDFDAEMLIAQHGLSGKLFHVAHARQAIAATADAIVKALKIAHEITHVGVGRGRVEQVASNRRVPGPDGRVKYVRYSSCRDPVIRAEPEGIIDPDVRLVSFWNGDRPLASLTYYATHPQSYYGAGGVSCDFPGLARELRDRALPNVMHVHFNGAGGNVTAGKYNDGAVENRPLLAARLAAGMEKAWQAAKEQRTPIAAADLSWRSTAVALPLRDLLMPEKLAQIVSDEKEPLPNRLRSSRNLIWARRCQAGDKIDLSALKLGKTWLVHMPGELFIEYQLAAQKMRENDFVCMAAYGDYGMGYIGTKASYSQGGYETSIVSRVGPDVEEALLGGLKELFK